jgi:hypothetical protein
VVNADADAFVRQATPTTNNGSATTLRADTTDGGGATHSYLRFTVPALATGETIQSAALSLDVRTSTEETAPGTDNGPAVWATSTSWTESTITWNNGRPARSGSAALGNFGRMDVGRVSTPVSGVTTSGVKSFELAPESGDLLITSSRQDTTTTNRPQLILTIATAGGSSTQPPAAPTNLAASAGDARVTLNWSASSGATGYDVYRASGGGSLTRVGSATPTTTATSFTDTGLTNGTQYSYAVRAINSAGQSGNSNTVTATPAASTSTATRTVTLTPVADVHIRQAAPTTTHGSVTRMNVDLTDTGAVGSEARAYLRFEVPPLATGETIQSARLSVQVTDATTDGPAIWKTATAWTEATMTWNSGRPARSGLAAVGNFVDMPLGRRSVPVSDVTASGPVSFELAPDGYNLLVVGSREDTTTTNRPQLILTIATG